MTKCLRMLTQFKTIRRYEFRHVYAPLKSILGMCGWVRDMTSIDMKNHLVTTSNGTLESQFAAAFTTTKVQMCVDMSQQAASIEHTSCFWTCSL